MRILVVEDERKIAALLCKALAEAGYAVNELFRGDEALDALRETPYDAAVLDVMLPGLDGLAVLRRLRAESNPVPILLLTARGEISDKVEGLELGADDYLSKPYFRATKPAKSQRFSIPDPEKRSFLWQPAY